MKITVLASGSSGNSTYLESNESKILIDAGISAKKITNELSSLGIEICELDAVLVSHEHTDHIKGVEKLHKKGVNIFMNKATFLNSNLSFTPRFFNKDFTINDLKISAISVSHDAAHPVGFKIKNNGSIFSSFTDLGVANAKVKNAIKESSTVMLESNHDIDMLINGPYPYHLKQRILSHKGHLSNIDAGLLIKENSTDKLKKVFLAHLSKTNNSREVAISTVKNLSKHKNIITEKLIQS